MRLRVYSHQRRSSVRKTGNTPLDFHELATETPLTRHTLQQNDYVINIFGLTM